jgi:aspartate kinase
MKLIVMKFGGTSIADGEMIKNVAKLVKKEKRRKVVVVSAMAGVTDKLINIANKVVDLPNNVVEREVDVFCRELLMQHRSAVMNAITDKRERSSALSQVIELIDKLKVALLGVGYLEDLSPKSLDYIQSFGELLNIITVSCALKSVGVKSVHLTGYEVGIVTDSSFGRAHPIFPKLRKNIPNSITPLIKKGVTPVIAGFVAADEQARITTLGRGGSDYTASLLGRYLKAEEVQIWTDVDGILSTDPKIVKEAELISTLSYIEAMDLAYFGAKVIHSKMIEPAMQAKVAVRVKNTFNPDCDGTLIVSRQKKIEGVIKAVAISKDVVIVNLQGVGMAETPNIAGNVFGALGEGNINVIMISGSSESNLSFVIGEEDVELTLEMLNNALGDNTVRGIEVIRDVAIVTVVGAGMQGTKGIAAAVFTTVAEANANIIMIAQGSSEVNIAFMIRESDVRNVVSTLHNRFIE